jgi:hypothetical protein
MIDIEKIKERKKIRKEILEELYELWFNTESSALVGTKQQIYQESSERQNAFHYLLSMEFIDISTLGERLVIRITAKGIEHVEIHI